MGRPSLFSPEVADLICERIATTPRGLDHILSSDEALPSSATVHRWLNDHPAFCESYLRARERQADLIFDECLSIADDGTRDVRLVRKGDEVVEVVDTDHIQRAKLRVDTRLRMAGKLHPKKYGDKLDLNHGGAIGGSGLTQDQLDKRIADIRAELKAGS